MADLDDFFKKRDKKKKQGHKSKFATLDTEEFAKQLEATSSVNETSAPGLDGENVSEAATLTGGEQQTASSSTVNHHHQTTNHSALSVGDALPDEEWKPFDSEENKDYSGLRINQNWKLEDEEDADEDADNDDTQKKVAFTWGAGGKKKQQQKQEEEEKAAEEETSTKSDKPATSAPTVDGVESDAKPKTAESESSTTAAPSTTSTTTESAASPAGGAYVPPHLRNRQQETKPATTTTTTSAAAVAAGAGAAAPATGSAYVPPHLRNKGAADSGLSSSSSSSSATTPSGGRRKVQPNINDTMEFPTLAAAVTVPETADKTADSTPENASFVQSKKGSRVETNKSKNPMIDLENKFTALETSNN